MREKTNKRGCYMASCCALILAVAAMATTLFFSVSDNWVQNRVMATASLYVLAIPLFEFGNSGRWFPQFSMPKSVLTGLLRGLAGISGFVLLLAAFGFCLAIGPGKWKLTTVGFVLGMCGTSLLLIRSAITGTWLPRSTKCN